MAMTMRAVLLCGAMLALSGCVAYPVDGYGYGPAYAYGPAYVAPPVGVYVGGGYRPYYHRGWGGWHRGWR